MENLVEENSPSSELKIEIPNTSFTYFTAV